MPEKTRQEVTRDGWFRTGDLGVLGGPGIPDHYLSIVGRAKDLIISGGYNVYPKEIELVIDAMPGVQESAVIGVPHADFGEAGVAVVVPQRDRAVDVDGMLADLTTNLANFKVPKKTYILYTVKHKTTVNVQKTALRKQTTT